MKTLQQKAREYFNDELSGEPLTQEAVEEALIEFWYLCYEESRTKTEQEIWESIKFNTKLLCFILGTLTLLVLAAKYLKYLL